MGGHLVSEERNIVDDNTKITNIEIVIFNGKGWVHVSLRTYKGQFRS